MKYLGFIISFFPIFLWANICEVDFDTSIGKGTNLYYMCLNNQGIMDMSVSPASSKELLIFFKRLFENNNLKNVPKSQNEKNPNIIPFIWLGQKFPDKFKFFKRSWITHHPHWTFIFWVDNPINYDQGILVTDIAQLQDQIKNNKGQTLVVSINALKLQNQKYFEQCTNFGQKSDILRYEILYNFGGLYVDVDFECLRPFDILHNKYDFYAGIQPLDCAVLSLSNALIGSKPGHPILKSCIENLFKNKNDMPEMWVQVTTSTGPVHFTRMFWNVAQNDNKHTNIAFPPSFFYPVSYNDRLRSRQSMETLLKPESFAIHHWHGSWL